jgi:hypothetical protein
MYVTVCTAGPDNIQTNKYLRFSVAKSSDLSRYS